MSRCFTRMVCLLASLAMFSAPAANGADEDPLKLDRESLQGRWERVTGGQKPGREVLLIEKDRETLTLEQKDGTVIRTLTAKIELQRTGDVRIYDRSEITLTAGSLPPNFTKSQSFIYKVDGDLLYEVTGLLYGRTPSRAVAGTVRWQRPKPEPEATPAEKPAADPLPNAEAEWKPDDPDLKRDLALLQGRWERISRNAAGVVDFQQEKVIKGNQETLTRRDGAGQVLSKHAVKFQLEKHGPVRIFRVYEYISFDGDKPSSSAADFSYVYRVDEKELLDAPGLFATRSTYQATPVIYKWQRAAKPDEATPR